MINVFISSTIYDLLDIRAEIQQALENLGFNPLLSESPTSGFKISTNDNSIESCLQNLRDSDFVVIILCSRYGGDLGVAGFESISATHLEFKEAQKHNKPIYFFVRDRLISDYNAIKRVKNFHQLDWAEQKKNLNWIKRQADTRLFHIIDEFKPLKNEKVNNFYLEFRDSTVIKKNLITNLKRFRRKVELNDGTGFTDVEQYLTKLDIEILKDEVKINIGSIAFLIYKNGLRITNHQFMATSFIFSEFWFSRDSQIVDTNLKLHARLKKNGGFVKRLFISNTDLTDEIIEKEVEEAYQQAQLGKTERKENLKQLVINLTRISEHVDMKIISTKRLHNFPKEFDPREGNEIAIYDNFRIDKYRMIKGKMDSLIAYKKSHPAYGTYYRTISDAFNQNWNSRFAIPITKYLNMFKDAIQYNETARIDLTDNWIDKFIILENTGNEILLEELNTVLSYLKETKSHYRNYLDVGVCTARYPRNLFENDLVTNIFGFDSDSSVDHHLNSMKYDFNQNFTFQKIDICFKQGWCENKFDLITCMFGTSSHIDDNVKKDGYPPRTRLELAIKNMFDYLKIGGKIIISNWKEWEFINKKIGKFLYDSEKDVSLLEANTFTFERLNAILASNSFDYKLSIIDSKLFSIYLIEKIS